MKDKDTSKNEYLSLDDIQNSDDITTEDVDVPEWGGKVKIKGLSAEEYQTTINMSRGGERIGEVDIQVATVVMGLVSPKMTPKQVVILKKKSMGPLSRIFNRIYKLSGLLSKEEAEKLEADKNASSEDFS